MTVYLDEHKQKRLREVYNSAPAMEMPEFFMDSLVDFSNNYNRDEDQKFLEDFMVSYLQTLLDKGERYARDAVALSLKYCRPIGQVPYPNIQSKAAVRFVEHAIDKLIDVKTPEANDTAFALSTNLLMNWNKKEHVINDDDYMFDHRFKAYDIMLKIIEGSLSQGTLESLDLAKKLSDIRHHHLLIAESLYGWSNSSSYQSYDAIAKEGIRQGTVESLKIALKALQTKGIPKRKEPEQYLIKDIDDNRPTEVMTQIHNKALSIYSFNVAADAAFLQVKTSLPLSQYHEKGLIALQTCGNKMVASADSDPRKIIQVIQAINRNTEPGFIDNMTAKDTQIDDKKIFEEKKKKFSVLSESMRKGVLLLNDQLITKLFIQGSQDPDMLRLAFKAIKVQYAAWPRVDTYVGDGSGKEKRQKWVEKVNADRTYDHMTRIITKQMELKTDKTIRDAARGMLWMSGGEAVPFRKYILNKKTHFIDEVTESGKNLNWGIRVAHNIVVQTKEKIVTASNATIGQSFKQLIKGEESYTADTANYDAVEVVSLGLQRLVDAGMKSDKESAIKAARLYYEITQPANWKREQAVNAMKKVGLLHETVEGQLDAKFYEFIFNMQQIKPELIAKPSKDQPGI